MSGSRTARAAIDDARALLGTMIASDVKVLHVALGDLAVFISRERGPSPLANATPAAPIRPAIATTTEHQVKAPHVGTVDSIVLVGAQVEPGQTVATLRVLENRKAITSDRAGVVASVDADVGALVEFGQSLVTIAVQDA